jgi:hypothetical protein
MAIVGRLEALARLQEGHERMDALLAHLKGKDLTRPAAIGNGDWSAKDLIGHVATWEELALSAIRDFGSHRTPWPERKDGVFAAPATGKISAFNARTVGQKRGLSLPEVRAEARRTHRELLSSIESLSDDDWKARAFYPTPNNRRRTLAALLGAILAASTGAFRHDFDHLPDLEAYVRSSIRSR